MTGTKSTPNSERPGTSVALVLAGVLAQVGCVTLLILLVSILGGLWLDEQFDTRPLFTVVLAVVSAPVTFYLIVRIVLRFTTNYRNRAELKNDNEAEEATSGADS